MRNLAKRTAVERGAACWRCQQESFRRGFVARASRSSFFAHSTMEVCQTIDRRDLVQSFIHQGVRQACDERQGFFGKKQPTLLKGSSCNEPLTHRPAMARFEVCSPSGHDKCVHAFRRQFHDKLPVGGQHCEDLVVNTQGCRTKPPLSRRVQAYASARSKCRQDLRISMFYCNHSPSVLCFIRPRALDRSCSMHVPSSDPPVSRRTETVWISA